MWALLGSIPWKYLAYAAAALAIVVTIITTIVMWRNDIKSKAVAEQKAAQMEQVVKEQQKFIQQLKEIDETKNQIIEETSKNNEDLRLKVDDVNKYIDGEQDKPASDILKNTIKKLQDISK